MFFAVKEERESVKSKYFWHFISLSIHGANIGIIFNTSKYFCNYYTLSAKKAPLQPLVFS
jgi:hypothetical protein